MAPELPVAQRSRFQPPRPAGTNDAACLRDLDLRARRSGHLRPGPAVFGRRFDVERALLRRRPVRRRLCRPDGAAWRLRGADRQP